MRSWAGLLPARVTAGLAAAFWGVYWFGLIDLLVVVEQDERFRDAYLVESGWGLLFLVVVTGALVVLAVRPGDPHATAQLAVATTAVLVGGAWSGTQPPLRTGLGLLATTVAVALPGRSRSPRWRRPDAALALLAVVALPAAVVYGEPLARSTIPTDVTRGVSHDPLQASLALALVGLVALASVTGGRLPVWTAALCACWLGVGSVVYPHLTGSLGTLGGALAVVWGVLVAASGVRRTADGGGR